MKITIPILLIFFTLGFSCDERPKEKYNFMFIIIDDLVPVLGSYGNEVVRSPQIDKLSSEGVQFNRAYCNVPVCGASRASLFTGVRPRYPDRFIIHYSRADKDSPEAVTLPKLFKDNGYYTISNGKVFHDIDDSENSWSEKPWRPSLGSRSYKNPDSATKINQKTKRGPYFEMAEVADTAYSDGKLAEKSIRDLQKLSGLGQPFFLAVGFSKPHLPFYAPKRYYDLYNNIPIAGNRFSPENLPAPCKNSNEILTYGYTDHFNTDLFHREARHAYYACVSYVDAQVGMLMNELKNLGLEKNTIVVLIGDHGWHLGEHNFWGKHNTLLNALHAPMIIKVPGNKPLKVDKIVEFVDLYPTFCELASIPVPNQLYGESLVPLMEQKRIEWKNTAFSEWQGARSVITEKHAYTYWFEEKHDGAQMLYDHSNDPEENVNVADLPKYSYEVTTYKQMILNLYNKAGASIK